MGYYWTYYLVILFISLFTRAPWLVGAVVIVYLLRSWLPDPIAIARNISRISSLKRQVELNRANVPARRDLGRAYLDVKWSRTALRYLDEAWALDPKNQEIAFLRGLALLGTRENEQALVAFGEAVGADEPASAHDVNKGRRVDTSFKRFDEAYLGAATALERLKRLPQAEEALSLSATFNTSQIEPLVRLARVRAAQGNRDGQKEAIALARKTWSALPGFMRRHQLGWGIRAMLG